MLLHGLSSSLLRRHGSKTLLAFLHHRRLGDPLSFSSSSSITTAAAAATVNSSSPGPQFMVEYLITSCGLSPSEAAKASTYLRRIKSPQRPDSVLGFFKSQGFDDADIRKIVSRQPRCLGFDVEKTLAPKFRALRDLGFSQSDLPQLVVHPSVLKFRLHRTLLPRIELWRNLFGSLELLKKFLKRKNWFLNCSIEKRILPNLSLLRDYGIPDKRISYILKRDPSLIVRSPDSLRHLVGRVEELGVSPHSGMFAGVLQTLQACSKARFEAKMELMRSFGWSESEFLTALSKAPSILNVSKKVMQGKMEFLVEEAGCTPSYVARFPLLLMFSLDKRLVPRYRAIEILKSKGLHTRKCQLYRIMCVSEKDFFEKFILCHKDEVPELPEMFTAGCKKAAS
ncbi:transcription termination factor MTERF6, chloroplastic/mitochondrial [Cocos nucifera]|uniref:Transcription termination factor MTERF6, chloroplastic/mitochondrial n=1 Tax=Cocos nucifera TaxID=13894 RepID=A0A8K0ITG3_COCNU|nr:transcription termination factor MTERF6, chloroplastic/mitochondrial [Cocos nucifera]